MKIDFKNWSIGAKLIFVSSFVAIFSFFMPWAYDLGENATIPRNAFFQLTFVFFFFFLYPLVVIFKNTKLHKPFGILCGFTAIILGLFFISIKQLEIFGEIYNATGIGVYVFLFACVIFCAGIYNYTQPEDPATKQKKASANKNKKKKSR